MEISIHEIYGEHPHSLIERSSYGLGGLHPEPFVDKKVFRCFEIYSGLRFPVFGNQKSSATEAWGIDVVDSFQSTLVCHLNLCVDLRMFTVQIKLGL